MKIKNKTRFVTFIATLVILSGIGGFFVGSGFANECEEPHRETPIIEETEEPEPIAEETPITERSPVTIEFVDLGEYTITAYCGCEKCCGEWSSDSVIGAGGVELIEGVHCAGVLPIGTIVEVGDIGVYEIQDRPASWVAKKYNDKIIDIYFENHEDAVRFGKTTANVKKIVEVD